MRSVRTLVYFVALIVLLSPLQILSQTPSSTQPNASSASAGNAAPYQGSVKCTGNGSYVNRQGKRVQRPENCSGTPPGATAQCRDGSYSFSQSRSGTCSHHGGVAKWL